MVSHKSNHWHAAAVLPLAQWVLPDGGNTTDELSGFGLKVRALRFCISQVIETKSTFYTEKAFLCSIKICRSRLTINTAPLLGCCSGLFSWNLCFPQSVGSWYQWLWYSDSCDGSCWVAADKHAVGGSVWFSWGQHGGVVRATAQHLEKKMDFRCGREIAKCEFEPRHVCLSVRSDRTGRIFMKFYVLVFLGNL